MKAMYKNFTKAQVDHLDNITNIDARYTCAMRYMRELNEGKKGERIKAMEYYERYGEILEGLDCMLTSGEIQSVASDKISHSRVC